MTDPTHRTMVRRFERAFVPDPRAARWYDDTYRLADRWAGEHELPVSTVAGLISATSVRTLWADNVRRAEHAAATGNVFATYAVRRAVRRILLGEDPLTVLRGPKTNAFYRAIMGDLDAAVVDKWIAETAGVDPDTLTLGRYRAVAHALGSAARRAGERTAPYQAQVWVAVRGSAD